MKKLSELTPEEIKALLQENETFKKWAQEYAQESTDLNISYVLRPFQGLRGIDYNIGYPGDYFRVSQEHYKDFLEACQEYEVFFMFSESTQKLINRAENRAGFFEDCLYNYIDISDKKWSCLEKWMNEVVHTATSEILQFCTAENENIFDDAFIEEEAIFFCENNDQYETDGRYIYEITRRKYA